MATQKTVIRRYNDQGSWDSIYLATSSDIVMLGEAITLAKNENTFNVGGTLAVTETMQSLITKIVNRLTKYDTDEFPGLKNGNLITALQFNNYTLTGTVPFENLPSTVSGKLVTVASEAAKNNLTTNDVRVGDHVKVTGGAIYLVKTSNATDGVQFEPLSDESALTPWRKVSERPTTVTNNTGDASDSSKLYLTNVVLTGDLIDANTATPAEDAGKAVKLNSAGKLGFSITGDAQTLQSHNAAYFATQADMTSVEDAIGATGTVPVDPSNPQEGERSGMKGQIQTLEDWQAATNSALNLTDILAGVSGATLPLSVIPRGAQEILYHVTALSVLADKTDAGYPEGIGNGDTVQVGNDGDMYFVTDESKLGTINYEQGLQVYTAGTASSVQWTGVLNTPTTLSGYGITDAVNTSDVVSTAEANKILRLNSEAKLPASITGDAQTLQSHNAAYFATAQDLQDVVTAIGVTPAPSADPAVAGSGIRKDIYDLSVGTKITALQFNNYTLTGIIGRANLPNDVSGNVVSKATMSAAYADLTPSNAFIGLLVKLNDGSLYMVTDTTNLDNANGYTLLVSVGGSRIAWAQIDNIPTTIIKTGTANAGEILLTNAVISGDVSNTGINPSTNIGDTAKEGKIISVQDDGKLHADVTHMGGHQASWYASNEDLNAVSLSTLQLVSSESDLGQVSAGQMCLVPFSAG